MEAMRQTWTDDRMDDLVVRVDNGFAHVDQRFEQVDQRFAEIHVDMAAMRTEQIDIRKELSEKATRQELSELRSEMTHRFDRLQNMLLTGFATLVVLLVVAQVG